jgi:hypothetical protein
MGTCSMGQNAGQMGEVALINRKDTFRANCLRKTIESALVEITGLVVHAGHNRVCGTKSVGPTYSLKMS